MSTGVESFQNLAEMGAIYPFQGLEFLLVIIGFAFWIGWHVWQLKHEANEYSVEIKEVKEKANINRALQSDAKS